MIYVTSDLHGCSPEDFQRLLNQAGFRDEDFLFVLGDVIDRGQYGAELLLWLTQQSNMQLILGNHEAFLLSSTFVFLPVEDEGVENLSLEEIQMAANWISNGAGPTLEGLQRLMKADPESVEGIVDYLRESPLYEEVEAAGQKFLLVHAGLANFRPDRSLEDYAPEELLWDRPGLDTSYYPDRRVIFGHTPTLFYGEEYAGRPIHTKTWSCIDVGVAGGYAPMLLRLDDGKEFYLE